MAQVTVNGQTITLNPGDSIELGEEGLIVFFEGKEADGVRLIHEARADRTRQVIEFVENRVRMNDASNQAQENPGKDQGANDVPHAHG